MSETKTDKLRKLHNKELHNTGCRKCFYRLSYLITKCVLPARLSYFVQYGKMASGPEKGFCMLVFHETKYVGTVQRQFRQKYDNIPPETL